mmetsp:Transcript_4947/g.4089  ORF Transcript_4947/g.4089 Transcript_4947/m.4089 type:complete len:137 (+) Transcript_4947:3-413(+)
MRHSGPIRSIPPQQLAGSLTGTFLAVNGLSPTSTSSSTTCGSPTATPFALECRDGAPVQSYEPPFGCVGLHSGYGSHGSGQRKMKLDGPPGYGYENGSGYGQSSPGGVEYNGACRFPLISIPSSQRNAVSFASAPY